MPLSLYGFTFHALGTPNELQFYTDDKEAAGQIANLVIQDIKDVEQKYSRYLTTSIISEINRNAGKEAVEVDGETAALFDYAHTCYLQSDGLFDITSGILRRVWDFKKSSIPSQAEINALLPLIGWDKVTWNKPFIRLSLEGMEIDLGGIGKEYAVDRAVSFIMKHGIKHGLINLGGDLRIIGAHLDGSPWNVGIAHPRDPKDVLMAVQLKGGAMATSGDYERYIEVDGKRYCHILNPKTGLPVDDLQAVSVMADSCLVAGTVSTVVMLQGEKKGKAYLRELGLPAIIVNGCGKIIRAHPEISFLVDRIPLRP